MKKPFNHRIYFLLPIDNRFFSFLCVSSSFQNAKIFSHFAASASVKKNLGIVLRSFILSRALIGFRASSDECDEKTLLDQEITRNFCVFRKHFYKLFHKSNRPHFLWVSWLRLVISKLFSCSPNIPRGLITPGNP